MDSVSVRFSGKVKGRGKFSVAGMRVISAGKARGRVLRLRVAEGNVLRSGPAPASQLPLGPEERPRQEGPALSRRHGAPRSACAPADLRRDHRRRRRRARRRPAAHLVETGQAAAWRVHSRCRASRSATSRGPAVALSRLRLAEHGSPDSGSTPPVAYSRVKQGGVRGRGGQALAGGLTATRDGVAPVLASARTSDSDSDGLLDTIFASFSEPVRAVPGGPSVAGAQVTGATTSDGELTLGVAEGPLGTGARPQLSYGAGEVSDEAGNAAAAVAIAADDGAGPVITAASSADRDGDGRLDTRGRDILGARVPSRRRGRQLSARGAGLRPQRASPPRTARPSRSRFSRAPTRTAGSSPISGTSAARAPPWSTWPATRPWRTRSARPPTARRRACWVQPRSTPTRTAVSTGCASASRSPFCTFSARAPSRRRA